jgi:DNA-binding NtrC family response regulator
LLDADGNKKLAAERLGWAPSRLSGKIKKLKLTPEPVK